ncbi:MAG: hypothetical protein WDW36_004450 [Sanguina aurantia]
MDMQHSHDTTPGIEERGKDIVWTEVAVETRRPWISQTTVGLLLFAFSTLMVTLMGTTAKLLAQRGLPVFEIVLVRSLVMSAACVPLLIWQGVDPRGKRTPLLGLRGLLGFGSVSSIYWAVALLPLGDATLLSFLAPLFVAVSAPMLLGEVPSRHAMCAVPACHVACSMLHEATNKEHHCGMRVNVEQPTKAPPPNPLRIATLSQKPPQLQVCFIGVLLVAKPGTGLQGSALPVLGVAVGVAQAIFSAGAKMSVRELRKSEVSLVIVFWMAAVSTLMAGLGCVLLPEGLRMPSDRTEWLLLLGTALAGMGNQACSSPRSDPGPGTLRLPPPPSVRPSPVCPASSPSVPPLVCPASSPSVPPPIPTRRPVRPSPPLCHSVVPQVSMTLALRRVQAVSAIALSYLSIVWSLSLGALVFHEHPDAVSLGGAALICSCTLLLSVSEVQKGSPRPALVAAAGSAPPGEGVAAPAAAAAAAGAWVFGAQGCGGCGGCGGGASPRAY